MPRSKAVYVQRRFRCSWLLEVPGEYPAALDKKCAGFAQACLVKATRSLAARLFEDFFCEQHGRHCIRPSRVERQMSDSLDQLILLHSVL